MLIATSFAVALLASPPSVAAPPVAVLPPIAVNVTSAPDVSPTLIAMMLKETEAIWRGAGFSFVWRRAPRDLAPYARTADMGSFIPAPLSVVVGHDTRPSEDGTTVLGWIVFDDERSPEQEVYVSYRSTLQLLEQSEGAVNRMPRLQRDTLLARAMGRALAHEIGHFLLRSKQHTPKGLMQASRSAWEMFTGERVRFQIAPEQQMVVAWRLRQDALALSRERG
jgi:hypothetical protein